MKAVNLYEILSLGRDADDDAIRAAVERLTRQANALANTAPERSQQLWDHARAAKQTLLGGPTARDAYDRALQAAEQATAVAAISAQPLVSLDPLLPVALAHAAAFLRRGLYRTRPDPEGGHRHDDGAGT